jgi:hypothetical protein
MQAVKEARRKQHERVISLAANMPAALRANVSRLVAEGRKIDAIREYQRASGEDLSTAKVGGRASDVAMIMVPIGTICAVLSWPVAASSSTTGLTSAAGRGPSSATFAQAHLDMPACGDIY